jgi:hypothetical protein
MDTPHLALHGQHTAIVSHLYMAFELGEKSWKLSLGDGVRAPGRCTVAAGDTTAVLRHRKSQSALSLAADAAARSCRRWPGGKSPRTSVLWKVCVITRIPKHHEGGPPGT